MFSEWENNYGKLQIISGKFQNNAIDDVKQISLSHAIIGWIRTSDIEKHTFLRCVWYSALDRLLQWNLPIADIPNREHE